MPPRSLLRLRLAFALALLLLLLGLWIEIPAPTYWLLTLTVGAPEMSAWLALLTIVPLLIAWIDRARRPALARMTAALALAALVLPLRVLARIPGTISTFGATLNTTIGRDYESRIPTDIAARMHSTPVRISTMFTGLGTSDASITRGVTFASPEGQTLALDIYRPRLDRPAPIVIQIYGGRWQNGAPGDDGALAMSLAARGYVVLAIDYRHAPRWKWPAQLDDVHASIRWARDHAAEFGGDPTKIALLGRSSGAQMAIIAGITEATPDLRAIVLYYSPVDLTDGYRHPGNPDTLHLRDVEVALLGGTPDDIPDVYRSASPIEYAGRPHPPVLLIDGGHDHIVKPDFGQVLADKLQTSGTCAFMVIPWADHAFDAVPFGPSAQIAAYYTERFLAWAMWAR